MGGCLNTNFLFANEIKNLYRFFVKGDWALKNKNTTFAYGLKGWHQDLTFLLLLRFCSEQIVLDWA